MRKCETEDTESSASAYLALVLAEKRPAPLDKIEAWANALDLTGPEREQFLALALLTHIPSNWRNKAPELIKRLT